LLSLDALASDDYFERRGSIMATMISKVYDAFIASGAPEDKAREAAVAVAAYDGRFNKIEGDLGMVRGDINMIRGDINVLRGHQSAEVDERDYLGALLRDTFQTFPALAFRFDCRRRHPYFHPLDGAGKRKQRAS
jgi:hypothetical protein